MGAVFIVKDYEEELGRRSTAKMLTKDEAQRRTAERGQLRKATELSKMSITREQRAELEELGPHLVRQKLVTMGIAPGTAVKGFKTASYLLRGDIEDWLVEKQSEGMIVQRYTLWAALIAAGVGILSLFVAGVTLWFTIWPRH